MTTNSISVNIDTFVSNGTIAKNERGLFGAIAKRDPALAIQLLGERATGKTKASERNLYAEVNALVSVKITNAQRDLYIELAARDVALFDSMVSHLAPLAADVAHREMSNQFWRLGDDEPEPDDDDLAAECRRAAR